MPLRRSFRKTAKRPRDDFDSDIDVELDNEYKPKTRRKTTISGGQKVHHSRGKGKLRMIVDMPLDILYEIFLHLYPLDILRLSRMNKALRSILMTKNVEFIWRQARLNLEDLPDCPADLNEPQYAKLLFDLTCDWCLGRSGNYIIWSDRRRICKECMRSLMVDRQITFDVPVELIASIYLRSKSEEIHTYPHSSGVFFCNRSADLLRTEYEKLDNDVKSTWLAERLEEKRSRIKHGRSCEAWIANRKVERSSEIDAARDRRFEAIKQNLIELGWKEELTLLGENEVRFWPSVRQSRDLTDRIWKNIKPGLIEKLETAKAQRLESEYNEAQGKRRRQLSSLLAAFSLPPLRFKVVPPAPDIWILEPFATMVKAPSGEAVHFPDDLLLDAVQTWRHAKDNELLDMLVASCPNVKKEKDSIEALSLATTFFKCYRSGDGVQHMAIGYPEVFAHRCTLTSQYGEKESDLPDGCSSYSEIPWNWGGNRVSFSDEAYNVARGILEVSGFDPDTVSRKDLQTRGVYFECHQCQFHTHSEGQRVLLPWLATVPHRLTHDLRGHTGVTIALAKLSDDDRQRAYHLEIKELNGWDYSVSFTYSCVHCPDEEFRGSWRMRQHYKETHPSDREVEELVEDVHYIYPTDISGYRHQLNHSFVLKPIKSSGD